MHYAIDVCDVRKLSLGFQKIREKASRRKLNGTLNWYSSKCTIGVVVTLWVNVCVPPDDLKLCYLSEM